jgi:hypothetical protein
MRSMIVRAAALAALVGAPVAAQMPAAPAPGGMPMQGRGAVAGPSFFLAHVGELNLTDQQVVRLAAIARRVELRRQAQRAAFDSARTRFTPQGQRGDTAMRAQRGAMAEQFRAGAQKAQEQRQADLRDALAVLTPDQQAKAWQFAGRARGARAAGVARMRRGGQPGMRAPRGQGRGNQMGPRPGRPGRG